MANISRVKEILYTPEGKAQCSALLAAGTRTCKSTILYQNGRCKKHGGPTPTGIASPHYRGKGKSRHLPVRLLDKYEEAAMDEDLMSLHGDAAVVEARMNELLEHLDEGGGGKIMTEVDEALKAFEYAMQDNDIKAKREAWRRLQDAVTRGKTEATVWEEMFSLRDQKRKLSLAEAKRLQIMDQMVPVAKVNLLVVALLDAVRKVETDKRKLGQISEAFIRIMNGPREMVPQPQREPPRQLIEADNHDGI